MNIPLVDLKAQYQTIKPEIDPAIQRILDNTSFILGKEVAGFEKNFAAYSNVKHAIGVDSGTAALHLAFLLCGIGPGDEVITTTYTFIATAETISLTGATPVFVDIDPRTYNIDVKQVEKAITPRTKVIVPVHLYGQPAEMDPILELARTHNLRVVEDAAQAHGALYRGRRAGSMGDLAIFSFYPGKNLGAYGDAGMLVTNNDEFNDQARMLRDHGRKSKYEHLIVGYGYRLDAMQAAILDVKLKHLEAWNAARRDKADYYTELLSGLDLVTPYEPPHIKGIYHIYAVRIPNGKRDALFQHLKTKGIEAGVHYPMSLHEQPVYANLGYKPGALPVAEKMGLEQLSLPLYPEITREQQQYVVDAIREFQRSNN